MTEALFVVIGGLLAIAAAATVAPRIGIARFKSQVTTMQKQLDAGDPEVVERVLKHARDNEDALGETAKRPGRSG